MNDESLNGSLNTPTGTSKVNNLPARLSGQNHSNRKYRTIVIDPPWKLNCNLKDSKYYRCGKPLPYKTMTDNEMLDFPISCFAEQDCDLFLWVTQSKLPFGLKLIESWGFKYHVTITWDKTNGVSLNGIQRRTEMILYGYKGRMGINQKGRFIPTLIREKLKEHSRKPDVFYAILKRNTQSPRIDIFARQRRTGFDAWGDEISKDIQMDLDDMNERT